MTRRLKISICISIGSLLLFAWTGAYYAVCLMAFMIAIIIGSAVYVRYAGKSITARVTGGDETGKGEDIRFRLELTNGSGIPVLEGKTEVRIHNDFTGEDVEIDLPLALGGGEKKVIELPYKSEHCGRVRTILEQISVSDPLGLFIKHSDAGAEGRAYILPVQNSFELDDDRLRAFDQESYRYSPYKKGDDPGEVFAIREYEPGDPLKKIHWKLSGKTGKLQIKESGFPEDNDIIVLINRSISADSDGRRSPIDKAGDLTVSICYTLMEKSIPHTLAWFNNNLREMEIFRITDGNSLSDAVKCMLQCGFDEGRSTTIINYLSRRDIPKAQHLYISEDEVDVDKLRRDGEVTIFRPSNYK